MNGNLNFSWRLVIMPEEMIDYVIVHELVHLEIKDHSKRFYRYWHDSTLTPPPYCRSRWVDITGATDRCDRNRWAQLLTLLDG